jgi:hypothetical protein
MPVRIHTYLLGTLPSAGVLGVFPPGQYVPNLLVLNNYSKPSSLAHAYIWGLGPIPKLHCLSTCMLTGGKTRWYAKGSLDGSMYQ